MKPTSDVNSRIATYRRRYRKALQDMAFVIQKELEALDDDIFEPSSALDSTALRCIQEANRLKALLEVEVEP